jgi:hypothetical protein
MQRIEDAMMGVDFHLKLTRFGVKFSLRTDPCWLTKFPDLGVSRSDRHGDVEFNPPVAFT